MPGEEFLLASLFRTHRKGVGGLPMQIGAIMHNVMARLLPEEPKNLSFDAYEVRRIAKLARSLPEVRDDIISDLKASIEAGAYFVSGEMIAEMTVRRLFAGIVA
jgi:hypothetical protein